MPITATLSIVLGLLFLQVEILSKCEKGLSLLCFPVADLMVLIPLFPALQLIWLVGLDPMEIGNSTSALNLLTFSVAILIYFLLGTIIDTLISLTKSQKLTARS